MIAKTACVYHVFSSENWSANIWQRCFAWDVHAHHEFAATRETLMMRYSCRIHRVHPRRTMKAAAIIVRKNHRQHHRQQQRKQKQRNKSSMERNACWSTSATCWRQACVWWLDYAMRRTRIIDWWTTGWLLLLSLTASPSSSSLSCSLQELSPSSSYFSSLVTNTIMTHCANFSFSLDS